jgi:hypothetical protein
MPQKLSSTVNKILRVPNSINSSIIRESTEGFIDIVNKKKDSVRHLAGHYCIKKTVTEI